MKLQLYNKIISFDKIQRDPCISCARYNNDLILNLLKVPSKILVHTFKQLFQMQTDALLYL